MSGVDFLVFAFGTLEAGCVVALELRPLVGVTACGVARGEGEATEPVELPVDRVGPVVPPFAGWVGVGEGEAHAGETVRRPV